jgi:membrane protein DedA with SNARE-associated domain
MDLSHIKDLVLGFVRDHQAWAPFIVAALAFGESLAFVSLLVPATVILLALGALVGAAGIPFWQVWLGAMLGAAVGDTVSYVIGRCMQDRAYRIWPLSSHPGLVERGERLFSRWGSIGVFVGRFFGPARAVVPLIAGIFAMPLLLFQAVNFSSASVWAMVMLGPGAGLMHYWPL